MSDLHDPRCACGLCHLAREVAAGSAPNSSAGSETYPLFKHMLDTYNLTLIEDEIHSIIAKADESRMKAVRSTDFGMNAQEQLRQELIAVIWRYAQESNVTILEAIKAAHQAAERIAQIALDAKHDDDNQGTL